MRLAWLLSLLIGVAAIARPAWADDRAPVIEHTPVTTATLGEQVTIVAKVTDESEVFPPSLTYRAVGSGRNKVVNMVARQNVGQARNFEATLNIDSSVDYWIEVYDEFGNGPSRSGNSSRPHRIEATAPVVVERRAPKPAPTVKAAVPKEEKDLEPPVITHTPLGEVEGPGPYTVTATIADPSGVFAPTVYARPAGETKYQSVGMKRDEETFSASLHLKPPFDYWLEAYDNLGNGPSVEGSADSPHRVELRGAAFALDEFDAPSKSDPKKWWVIGGASVVGAAVIGSVIYAIASQPSYGAWIVTQPSRRR